MMAVAIVLATIPSHRIRPRPGIPEALRSRVFEPFVRLEDRPDQGQGLGLHVVKLLTEAHGGRAWVQSSPLGGARFCVLLPTGSDRAD